MSTALSKQDQSKLQKCLEAIDKAKSHMVHGAVEIGQALIQVREVVVAKDEFVEWVESNCGFSKSTAYRYVEVAQRFGGFPKIEHFQDSALYVLVKNEEAIRRAKAMASRGKRITHELAKEILKEVEAASQDEETEPESIPKIGNDESQVIDVESVPVSEISEIEGELVEPEAHAEPAPPAAPPVEEPPAGGYEPEEARKPLAKLAELVAKTSRAYADVEQILGRSPELRAVFTGIDQASIALTKFRARYSKRVR